MLQINKNLEVITKMVGVAFHRVLKRKSISNINGLAINNWKKTILIDALSKKPKHLQFPQHRRLLQSREPQLPFIEKENQNRIRSVCSLMVGEFNSVRTLNRTLKRPTDTVGTKEISTRKMLHSLQTTKGGCIGLLDGSSQMHELEAPLSENM